MKSIRLMLAVAFVALATVFSAGANAQSLTGDNQSTSIATTGSYSNTANYFTSPAEQTYHQDYSGEYTVKQNSSVVLGAFAPSMSGYNCAATAQAGASQANAGITAALGVPLLLDPGMMCVFFTAANMDLQQAIALGPVNKDAAMAHVHAAEANLCNVGEVYQAVRDAQRAGGVDCPLGVSEKKQIDKNVTAQYSNRDQTKPFTPGVDLNVENAICGDDPSQACLVRLQKRIDWKARELATPVS